MKFICFTITLLALSCLLTTESLAQKSPEENPPTSTCASVSLSGVEIACLSKSVGSVSPTERAKIIKTRLASLASDPSFDPDTISAHKISDSEYMISSGDIVILSLQAGDTPDIATRGLEDVAHEASKKARSAIMADRLIKSPNAIMTGILKSLGATLLLILILFFFGRVSPKFHSRIDRGKGRFIRSIKIQSFELLNSARIIAFLHWLVSAVRVMATLLTLYVFVPLVLSFFPWTAGWSEKLFSYILNPFTHFIHVVADYIPNLFFVAAIVLLTRYLLKMISFFFGEIGRENLKFEGFYSEWAEPTYKLVRVIIIAFAFVMAFPYLPGSSSPAFQGVSVFLGLLLSFGSSSAVANIVAGVVLTYMRPFKAGDRVKIADTIGDVLEKTLLVTRVKTIKHVEVTIPNSMVLGSHIVNYSSAALDEGLILNTTVTIGYDVPWRKVHELLIEAAKRTTHIDSSRRAFVLQTALNDFYVSYELNAFTSRPNLMAAIYSELHSHIQDCFFESGIEIMSPHYSALRSGEEAAIPELYRQVREKTNG